MTQPRNTNLGEQPMTTYGRVQGPEKRYRRLRFPSFPAATWTAKNPLLQRGEIGAESDTFKFKIGDGVTYWNDLSYGQSPAEWGNIGGNIQNQTDLVNFVNSAVSQEASARENADNALSESITEDANNLSAHVSDLNNPHQVTQAQVGLGNVDNTSDMDKPVSTAQSAAISAAISEHNSSSEAHSNQFSQYRISSAQDTIDTNLQSQITTNANNITSLQTNKADKTTDFETPITASNKGATMAEIEQVRTATIKFIGYVATSAPSSGTYSLQEGNLWINSASMPTNFPVASSSIQQWNGTAWVAYSQDYTPASFDAWSNLNNNEGYYFFGGVWKIFSTDLSTEYFVLNQTSGLWEIAPSIELPGTPTVATPDGTNPQAIANVDYLSGKVLNPDLSNINPTQQVLAKTDLSNVSSNIDYIVESQEATEENGYTWYRLYKSGWVEQGGRNIGTFDVSFPIEMADTNYLPLATPAIDSSQNAPRIFINNLTTTGMKINYYSYPTGNGYWELSGQSAQ